MKLMIASDIHGSEYYSIKMINRFLDEKCDKLLLLGDILYHGPRNDLPKDYAPKKVIELLNKHSDKIFCVRGNCDSEVDQMVLDFPIMAEYCLLNFGNKNIYATHGHNFNKDNMLKLNRGDILLHGHTHVPVCEEFEDFIYMNPGSVSIPKENSDHGYMIIDNEVVIWKNLEGKELWKYLL